MIRDNIIYHRTDMRLQQSALESQDLQLEVLIKMVKTHKITTDQTSELQGNATRKINAIRNTVSHYGKDGYRDNRRIRESSQRRERSTGRPVYRSRIGTPGRYRKGSTARERKVFKCRRCNEMHGPKECPAYGVRCEKCSKYNHFTQACRASESGRDRNGEKISSDRGSDFSISTLKISNVKGAAVQRKDWQEEIQIKDFKYRFIDAGAGTNIIPRKMCCEIGIENAIKKHNIRELWRIQNSCVRYN